MRSLSSAWRRGPVIKGALAEPSVVGAFSTALAAVVAVVLGRTHEQRLNQRQIHRDQMAPIYERLFIQFAQHADAHDDPKEFFREVQRKMLRPAKRVAGFVADYATHHPSDAPLG